MVGFGVCVLGLGFGFRVLGFGFFVVGFGFWVLGFGFRVLGFGFWVLVFWFWVLVFGFWVWEEFGQAPTGSVTIGLLTFLHMIWAREPAHGAGAVSLNNLSQGSGLIHVTFGAECDAQVALFSFMRCVFFPVVFLAHSVPALVL